MVLTKAELIGALRDEVRILQHLLTKVAPEMVEYRPTPQQRSLIELLRYLAIMPPIHLRGTLAGAFDMNEWRKAWQEGEASAERMGLGEATEAIGRQGALAEELLGRCTDEELRAELEMFGGKRSRGAWIVGLVLSHYVAYRMQLFLYLKGCGRGELSTLNLWVGADSM